MMTKQIIYQPLKGDSVRRFAGDVGTKLAAQLNDARYADQEVVDGFANFLKIVSDMLVVHLNHQSDTGQLDTRFDKRYSECRQSERRSAGTLRRSGLALNALAHDLPTDSSKSAGAAPYRPSKGVCYEAQIFLAG